jgi:hypothetical protein
MNNITKTGIEVMLGQVWKDLDKRMPNRYGKVTDISDGKAIMLPCDMDGYVFGSRNGGNREIKISINRMHVKSTGWELQEKLTIKDSSDRRTLNLSNEVYVVKDDEHPGCSAGTLVRKISGVNDSVVPGYHFDPKWVTVCRKNATMAQFIGIMKKSLEPIK